MKLLIATLLLLSSNAFAAKAGDTEMVCDYIVATSTRSYSNGIKVIPSEQRGQITLVSDNGVYKAELVIAPELKINFENTIASDLALNIKVTQIRYSTENLVSTTSLHKPDGNGVFSGSQIVRNPTVESMAIRYKIPFESAALSENLANGINFIGAMISCN